jgi:tRNA threonylcarbamoyladenosine biosynthesis protein TsaB
MKLLAVETSSEACSVALANGGGVTERFELAARGHAERLLPWVEALLEEGGFGPGALDAIAFSRGPGSFTSLRIGIATVQGLAWGAAVGVVPVSSLLATALSAGPEGPTRRLVALDARMGEVWTAVVDVSGAGPARIVGDERVLAPDAVTVPEGDWMAVGNGFERCEALRDLAAGATQVRADTWPRASAVLQAARSWLEHHEPLPAAGAQPVYLRDRVARKPGKR